MSLFKLTFTTSLKLFQRPLFRGLQWQDLLIRKNAHRHMSTSNPRNHDDMKQFIEMEMNSFTAMYPLVKCQMKEMYPAPLVADKFEEFLDYNFLKISQLNHTRVLMFLYYTLSPQSVNDDVKKQQLYSVTWLVEMLRSIIFMIDDMVDRSEYRSGKICWYKDHEKTAANDLTCLYICIMISLKKVCVNNDLLRENLTKLFQDVTFETLNIVSMDFDLAKTPAVDDNLMDLYNWLCRKKVADLLTLITNTAIYLAGYETIPYKDKLDQLNSELSRLIQIKNDIADLPKTLETGKKKLEDISNGVVTWCLARALQDATNQQKQIIKKCYGRKDEDSIKRVCQLYDELQIIDKFAEEEANVIKTINVLINTIADENFRKIFSFTRDTAMTLREGKVLE